MAAERTGRICRGIEIDPLYVDIAIRCWQRMAGARPIHAENCADFATLEQQETAARHDRCGRTYRALSAPAPRGPVQAGPVRSIRQLSDRRCRGAGRLLKFRGHTLKYGNSGPPGNLPPNSPGQHLCRRCIRASVDSASVGSCATERKTLRQTIVPTLARAFTTAPAAQLTAAAADYVKEIRGCSKEYPSPCV